MNADREGLDIGSGADESYADAASAPDADAAGAPDADAAGVSAAGVADVYALTPPQAGMLYHTLATPNSGVYVVQYTCEITGDLDPTRFREAWERAFERHAVFRTAFVWEGLDEPLQAVRERVELPWTALDWSSLPESVKADRLQTLLREDRLRGFPLDLAPLVRLALIRTGANVWRFLWTFHHIVADGWSAVTLLGQVFREAVDPLIAAPTPRPFRDFVSWLGGREVAPSRAYWERRLAGIDGPTRIPGIESGAKERSGAKNRSTAGAPWTAGGQARCEVRLDNSETAALKEFARRHRLTLNTVVHGAWTLALSRYSGESDVVYATAVSGRPPSLTGVESMIGVFINSLPVRVRVEHEAEVVPWLMGLQNDLLDMHPHEHTSLASIAEWTGVGASRGQLDHILVFESSPLGDRSPAQGTGLELADVRYLDQSNFPFALLVFPGPSMALTAVYDTDRLPEDLVDKLLCAVGNTLRAFVANPTSALGALPPPSAEERDRVLARAAEDGAQPVEARDVMLRFRAHVEAQPEAIAVVTTGESWTYADLAARVRKTSDQLRARGVTLGTSVAVLLDRSPAAIQAILAVLEIGGVYVPIAEDEPGSRRRFLLEDAGVKVLLGRDTNSLTDVPEGVRVLEVGGETPDTEPPAGRTPDEGNSNDGGPDEVVASWTGSPGGSDPLAYILYTSGSTGRPKGVCVSRGNLAYSTGARDIVYERHPRAFLLLSATTFDSSIVGIFWTLSTGGTLVLPDPGQEREPTALAGLVRKHSVTHTLCVPALWALVLDQVGESDLRSLETVIVAGETCAAGLIEKHFERLPDTELYNEYGPTEGTVWATAHRVPDTFSGSTVPLGRPIPGTRLYLLDRDGRLAPDGAAGEIYIAGPGVAQGYRNHAELTETTFVPDPYSPHPYGSDSARAMYRTGDLGRWSAEGDLLFLGRRDDQVKVRGHRVELGEIESALSAQPGVREAAVATYVGRRTPGDLIAYVVGSDGVERSTQELRTRLGSELPAYMVPSRFIWLDALPRGRNGKLDRKRLPQPAPGEDRVSGSNAPRTPTEEALASLWREVLGLDSVGTEDHFFAVGGHSLLAIRLLGEIRGLFSVDFPFDEFFATPTIAGSAARIETLIAERRNREPTEEDAVEEFEF